MNSPFGLVFVMFLASLMFIVLAAASVAMVIKAVLGGCF